MIKVGIVGFGTIGKRAADAVTKQDDMELVGVTIHSYNYRMITAHKKGYKFYTSADAGDLKGLPVEGTMEDLLKKVDIVIDGTPKPHGAANIELYKKHSVKAILEGGEKHETCGTSFNAHNNYDEALNKDFVRVVSCNTTGLSRMLGTLKKHFKIGKVGVTLLRRSLDPAQKGKTVLNAIEPTFEFPSHHGPDVITVIPDIDITSVAFKLPTSLMHVHSLDVELKEDVSQEKILEALKKTSRIYIIPAGAGIVSTAQILELAKDLARERGDFMDLAVWEEGVIVSGRRLHVFMAVHQESIVIPDNIDCIRAMMGIEGAEASIAKTNKSLGLE